MGKYFGSSAVVAARGVFDPIEALGCCSARLRDWGHCGYFLVWNLRLFSLKVISQKCMTSDFHRFSNIHNSFLNAWTSNAPACICWCRWYLQIAWCWTRWTRDANCHKGKTAKHGDFSRVNHLVLSSTFALLRWKWDEPGNSKWSEMFRFRAIWELLAGKLF